jgi:hypothetical protein
MAARQNPLRSITPQAVALACAGGPVLEGWKGNTG